MTNNQGWVDKSPGWILLYEEAFLEGLARTLPNRARVVNIGAGVGTSSGALLRGARDAGKLQLLSVDLDAAILAREREYLEEQGLWHDDRIRQYLGTSDDAFEHISDDNLQLSLVFIDGSHEGAQVLKDIQNYTSLLAPGGLLSCHDYGDPRQRSVTDAINEWHGESKWFVLGRAIFTVAFLKPGGDLTWTKGRIEELLPEPVSEPEPDPPEVVKIVDLADETVKPIEEIIEEAREEAKKEEQEDGENKSE